MKPLSYQRAVRDWTKAATHRIPGMLVAAATLMLAISSFHLRQAQAQAGRIDTISPSCASVGAQVTITGIGFGAQNLTIAVGDMPAQLVTANGHSATFVVPAGIHLGPTTVTATNPGGQAGIIAFKVCDLVMPEAWAGEWEIKNTYRKATSNSITSTDDITAFIRTDEPFGLAPALKVGDCAGSVSDTHMEIQCTGQATSIICTLGTSAQITADRNGDSITGSGMTTLTFSSGCAPFVNVVENIQISGHRLNVSQGLPDPAITLVRSFVPFAGLIGARTVGGKQ
jgi:hypothetical protein